MTKPAFAPRTAPVLPARTPEVLVFTDGGCDPNPGPGGWAAILWTEGHELEIAGGERRTTNNRMELTAAIEGLRALRRPSRVTVVTDSQYVFHGMSSWIEGWSAAAWKRKGKPIPNADLWEALARVALAHETYWSWTRGHIGQPENERCDELVGAMRDIRADGIAHRARRERPGPLLPVERAKTAPIWLAD